MDNPKKNLASKFLRTSAVYFLGKILTYIVSFLMLRYYTSNISPDNYGRFEFIVSLIDVCVPLLFLEIWGGILRFAIIGDNNNKTTVITTSLLIVIPVLLIYSTVYFILNRFFNLQYSIIIYCYSVLFLALNILMMISRSLAMNKLFASSGILGAIANAIMGYVCIKAFAFQCEALMYANMANYALQIIILVYGTKVWRYLDVASFSPGIAKQILLFCMPFGLNTVLYYLNTNFYKTIINQVLGSDILGLFAVSTKFCVVLTFVVSIFHLSWQEVAYSMEGSDEKKLIYKRGLRLLTDILTLGCVLLLPFVKVVYPILVGDAYMDGIQYVPAYYSTIYFVSLSGFLYNTLAAEKITIFHPVAKFVAAIINIGLLFALISQQGIYAVIIASVMSTFIEALILTHLCERKIGVALNVMRVVYFIAIYMIAALVFYKTDTITNLFFMIAVAIGGGVLILKANPEIRQYIRRNG